MKNMHSVSRRSVLALGAGAACTVVAGPAAAEAAIVVVAELFTSQGCSSCPPADALLEELRTMPGVMALSYHVDYWDYLGWKDTLARPEYSQRQYDYAKARGDMDVYTPQIVVNGKAHMVGSQRSAVMAAIDRARQTRWTVPLTMSDDPKEMAIEIGDGDGEGEGTLWVLPLLRSTSVKIERGEIAGREIAYHNVVRRLVPAGMWSGEAKRIGLPKDGLMPPDATACAALLQRGKAGEIIGCATWGNIGA